MAFEAPSTILLKGGTLLIHNEDGHVSPTVTDLLIEDSTIVKIETNISAPSSSTKVIDCTNKIVSPGFINTHAHLWQTACKGAHPNASFVEYMPRGNFASSLYTLEDAFWGELAAALENIDGGTTLVVDHSHLNLGPDYPKTTIQALVASGLRTIYCYCPPRQVTSWKPFKIQDTPVLETLENFKTLAAAGPFGGSKGRVYMGFGIDNIYVGPLLKEQYAALRSAPAAHLITSHTIGGSPYAWRPSGLSLLDGQGVLGSDVLLSHSPYLSEAEARRLGETGAFVSSTPNTELQMGYEPVALQHAAVKAQASVGVDCHTWGTSYLPAQMTLLLQARRAFASQKLAGDGARWSRHTAATVEEVFNLGTVGGARAAGLADQVGQLKVGMNADIAIFDASSPGMLAAAAENPVAAIVLHSSVRDVETVIVDGVVRKEGGKLLDVRVPETSDVLRSTAVPTGKTFSWNDIAAEILKSRERLRGKMKEIDFSHVEDALIDAFYMNRQTLVD